MDKRQQLLNTALKLFIKHGFHGTPTSKIAKEAGIANGTLFYFFPTKDDLIRALYVEIKARTTVYILGEIKGMTDTRSMLRGYFLGGLTWGIRHPAEFRFVAQFFNSPYRDQIATEEIKQHTQPVLDLLKKAIDEHLIRSMDVDLLFHFFSGQVFSTNSYILDRKFDKKEQDAIANEAFDLYWRMIQN